MASTLDGDRIATVQSGYATAAEGDQVIDLKNATLMPVMKAGVVYKQ